jgi:hypothetical protein
MRRSVFVVLFSALVAAITAADPAAGTQGSAIVGVAPGQAVPMPVPGMPQPPPRDGRPGADPVKGTAVIRGVIVAADTGAPLRRAHVRVMGEQGVPGGIAETDAQGRFEVAELAAGRYSVHASRSGYVAQSYGQRGPNQSGTPIELAEGQRADRVNFTLTRAGAITGRIVDEFGEPLAGAMISVQRYAYMGGRRRLVGAGAEGGFDQTNDLGEYRLYGLAPGEYYVSAQVRSRAFMMPGMSAPPSGDGYAPTYFPGTASPASAERVIVKPGQDTTGVSFVMVSARLGRLSGRIVTSSGEPANGFMLMVSQKDASFGPGGTMEGTGVQPDGTFVTRPMPPGAYTLVARPSGFRRGNTQGEIARLEVTVNGEDVENLTLVTGPGGIIRGRIVTDDGTVPPFDPRAMRIFPVQEDLSRTSFMGVEPDAVRADWSFELAGLGDRVRLRWTAGQEGTNWSLKSALKDGVDLADTAIEVLPGQVVDEVEIVITQKITEVSGMVLDERGQPTTDATVVIFADDEERWTPGTRYIRTGRPDIEGKYRIRLAPGPEYLVAVVRTVEDGRYSDPEVLARLVPSATRLTIAEGESKVLDLRQTR